jgi:hypothetical protein
MLLIIGFIIGYALVKALIVMRFRTKVWNLILGNSREEWADQSIKDEFNAVGFWKLYFSIKLLRYRYWYSAKFRDYIAARGSGEMWPTFP